MVLHGSLHENVLSDIFSLLVRQKADGNLELFTEGKEGMLFFKDGMIAGALNNEELLSEKLFFLLADTCHYPLSEAGHLFAAWHNDMTGLCDEIVQRNLLSRESLESFAVSVIEDIVCRFFLWKSGTYHFSTEISLDAAGVCPAWLKLSAENLSMEATRRFDEWRRIKLHVDPDAVYAPTESRTPASAVNLHLHISTADLVLSRIDGRSPVSSIIRTSCLTKYKTYEAINALLTEKRIRPIEHRSFRPLVRQRPKPERRTRKTALSGRTLSAIAIVAGIVLATVLAGRFVLHGLFLSDIEHRADLARLELPVAEARQKLAFASLLFDASHGIEPDTRGGTVPAMAGIRNDGFLTAADLRPLYEIRMIEATSGPMRPRR